MTSKGRRNALAVAPTLLACLAFGCAGDDPVEPAPDAGPAVEVREAALRTLGVGPASFKLSVSSPSAGYAGRGGIELATDRFRLRATVTRAPSTHFDRVLDVVGVDGETYVLLAQSLGDCWFDPHAPVGALGGAASVQEAVALIGVAVRLLRDGIRTAVLVRGDDRMGKTYRVSIDPSRASLAPSAGGSDEVRIVGPRRLAGHLAPMRVRVGADGLVRRLSIELRRFRPATRGPGLIREHRRERVSIAVSLSDFGRTLGVRSPRCIAME